MKRRLLFIYIVIVAAPLAILGWLGARVAGNEHAMVEQRFHALLQDRLAEISSNIGALVKDHERLLLDTPIDPALIDEQAPISPWVRQWFALDTQNMLVYPSFSTPRNDREKAFLKRTIMIWRNKEIPGATPDAIEANSSSSALKKAASRQTGWYSWIAESGLNLIFWWRNGAGTIDGAEVDTVRLLADIIGALPDTGNGVMQDARIQLLDEQGNILYQWGGYSPLAQEAAAAERGLSPPLSVWKLAYFAPSEAMASNLGNSAELNLFIGLLGLGIALAALAAYFYRENTRELREASQRISFVNQVSHELKTPLTSIRMYAELLVNELAEREEKPAGYLKIIVSESQRLSRLIENVLTFSRKQRSALQLHPSTGVIDEAIPDVIAMFEETLSAKGIRIEFQAGAPHAASFDRDAAQQILGNLLNNAEKYAADATCVRVASEQQGDLITVRVADDGPGIPMRERRRIFEPFHRVSNALTDGVAGAGIGLSIARDLAELHGGSLTLAPSERGAAFVFSLRAPQRAGGAIR